MMSIRVKLLSILMVTVITFCGIGYYAVSNYNNTLDSKQAIRENTNLAIELSYQTASLFRSQFNSWKNLLMRDSNSGSYDEHLNSYYKLEGKARDSIEELKKQIFILDKSNKLGENLFIVHLDMGQKFREVVELFKSKNMKAAQASDRYVIDTEKNITDISIDIISSLKNNKNTQLNVIEEQRLAKEGYLLTATIACLLIPIILFVWLVDKNISVPAEEATLLSEIIQYAEHVAKFGTWDWDSKKNIHYWSESFFNILGIDKSQQPSLALFVSAFIESDQEWIKHTIEDAQRMQIPFEFEANIKSTDDNNRHVSVKGYASKNTQVNQVRMNCMVHDVTQQKTVHEQVLKSETRYRTLFETAGDAILVLREGKFINCNPQALVLFECSREELIGKSPVDFSPLKQYDGRESTDVAIDKINAAKMGGQQNFNWQHITLGGVTFDAEITLNRIELDGQECIQAIVRDVTERRRTEEAIKNIAAGVSAKIGEDFFEQLVLYLSKIANTRYAFIGIIDPDNPMQINTLSVSANGKITDNLTYSLNDTPCHNVIDSGTCMHPTGVQQEFPKDALLRKMGVDSYIGTSLFNSTGDPIGVIVLLNDKPLQKMKWLQEIIEIFAARASAELERIQIEKLNQKKSEELNAAINAMPGVFFMFDADGYVVKYNKGYKEIFNFSDKELEHLSGLERVHPEDYERCQKELNKVLIDGETVNVYLRAFDGPERDTFIYLLATGARIFLDGKPYCIGAAIDISELVQAQEELFIKERAMEAATEGIVLTNAVDGNKIIYVNKAMEELTGYSREELLGKNPRMLQGENTSAEVVGKLRNAIVNKQACQVEVLNYRKDGSQFWNETTITPVRNESGEVTHYIGTQLDISDRRTTEEALRRSQKMDAIGQLAGGVAHDFNNQLGIIIGYLDFLQAHLADEEKPSKWVDTAINATLRCMDLTRQLLTVSRSKAKEISTVDLNQEILKMDTLLSRTITPAIIIETYLSNDLWKVDVDPGEFQDMMLNLVINARDAMPNGGRLLIETSNKCIDDHAASIYPELEQGDYVQVMVSDTGEGMDKETQDRIFDPFFTTKEEGKGTGLGLAMVYGFTKRFKGDIKVDSEKEVGTTFRIFLPHSIAAVATSHREIAIGPMPEGTEAILIVDDEIDLLKLAEQYLQDLGYRTYISDKPKEALKLLKQHAADIDLLFSDVVMPGEMSGYMLAEKAVNQAPDLKVLLTSGFNDQNVATNAQAQFTANLLHKPYRQDGLAQRIRETLDK